MTRVKREGEKNTRDEISKFIESILAAELDDTFGLNCGRKKRKEK